MTNPTTSKLQRKVQCTELADAIRQRLAGETMWLGGKYVKAEVVAARLEGYVAALADIDAAFKAWRQATAVATRMYFGQIHGMLAEIRTYLQMKVGTSGLRAFGFAPRKRPYRSAESKRAAVEKARATRKARGTMGKRQRAKIKGVVPRPAT